MTRKPILISLAALLILSCGRNQKPDAYGILDAHGWQIASPQAGQIVQLEVEEGMTVKKGSLACQLDTSRLTLQWDALQAQIKSLRATMPNVGQQLEVLYRQRKSLQREKERLEPLVKSGTVSAKQLDEVEDQLFVLESKIAASSNSLSRETSAILANIEALQSQATLLRDQIRRCRIENPEDGTVSRVNMHLHEFIDAGQPIFKLTDYAHLYADAWLDAVTLSGISLGDSLTVKTDAPDGGLYSTKGRVSFISEEAEFTPNKVMTRESRTRQVYRVRIDIPAGGPLKPGMPVEIYK